MIDMREVPMKTFRIILASWTADTALRFIKLGPCQQSLVAARQIRPRGAARSNRASASA